MPKCDFNKLQSSFIEIALPHGCSPVNLLPFFRTPFLKNTSGWLLLKYVLFYLTIDGWSLNLGIFVILSLNVQCVSCISNFA